MFYFCCCFLHVRAKLYKCIIRPHFNSTPSIRIKWKKIVALIVNHFNLIVTNHIYPILYFLFVFLTLLILSFINDNMNNCTFLILSFLCNLQSVWQKYLLMNKLLFERILMWDINGFWQMWKKALFMDIIMPASSYVYVCVKWIQDKGPQMLP